MKARFPRQIFLTGFFFLALWLGAGLASGWGQVIPADDMIKKWSGEAPRPRIRGERGADYRPAPPVVEMGEKQLPFATDSAALLPPARKQLEEVARAMASPQFAQTSFMIAGHSDPRGSEQYNLKLAQRRAESVKNYLATLGVAANRLEAKGFGKQFARGTDAATWSLDRRVDILTVKYYPQYLAGLQKNLGGNLAVDLQIFQNRQGQPLRLPEGTALASGEQFRLYFSPPQDCYVWIYQVDSAGQVEQRFPRPEKDLALANPVKAHQIYWLPEFNGWLTLNTAKGEERFYVVATAAPSPSLDGLEVRFRERFPAPVSVAQRGGGNQEMQLARSETSKVRGVGGVKEEVAAKSPAPNDPGKKVGIFKEFEDHLKNSLPERHFLSRLTVPHM